MQLAKDQLGATADYRSYPHGWLSPGGKYYPCGWANHYNAAADIVDTLMPQTARQLSENWRTADDYLLRRGWVKVGGYKLPEFVAKRSPSQKQLDVVWDICQAHGLTMPSFD